MKPAKNFGNIILKPCKRIDRLEIIQQILSLPEPRIPYLRGCRYSRLRDLPCGLLSYNICFYSSSGILYALRFFKNARIFFRISKNVKSIFFRLSRSVLRIFCRFCQSFGRTNAADTAKSVYLNTKLADNTLLVVHVVRGENDIVRSG